MFRPAASPRWRALAAATLALAAAACTDQVTAPSPARTAPGAPAATAATIGRPALVPNTTRYRWHGARPATGRSGTAVLTTRALLGRDGTTELELFAGSSLDPWWTQREGTITKVQARAVAPDGSALPTVNLNGLDVQGDTTLTFGALKPGSPIHVQASVRGLDGQRTDVVSVTETVRRRPNLAITDVAAPARVQWGSSVNVVATVAETNGDVGAWSRCVLYAGGQMVDWAWHVWTDAGDAVSCAFTWRSALGTTELEVRLEDISPRDDDPSDNAATVTVEGVQDNQMIYSAYASQTESHSRQSSLSRWTYSDGGGFEWATETQQDMLSQAVYLTAWMPVGVSSVKLEVSESTDGTPVHSTVFDAGPVDQWWGWGCVSGYDGAVGATFFLCTGTGYTSMTYVRSAGRVTYHSKNYTRTWNATTGEEFVYAYNFSDASGGGILVPFGAEYSLDVRLTDGAETYTAAPVMRIQESRLGHSFPWSCFSYTDSWLDATSEYCSASESWGVWKQGSASTGFPG